jgi:choline dehydrogenase-like flavoprotein
LAGISDFLENWHEEKRRPAHLAYSLEGVRVITGAIAHRVVFSKDNAGNHVATAVLVSDGRQFTARKEIILSAGGLRAPQILMLSGIGPVDTLCKYGVPMASEVAGVGTNLFNHFAHFQIWKLRDPEKGLTSRADVVEDTTTSVTQSASLLDPSRCHVKTLIVYSTIDTPPDGTQTMSSVMLLLPTSRGSVTIVLASPTNPPAINPNDYATRADRVSLMYGTHRVLLALLDTSAGKA